MYSVYQFIDKNDKIIYIGKTKRNINDRMQEHFSVYGHLPKECYDSTIAIKYYNFLTEKDMDIAEAYLIKKYKPIYNKRKEFISSNETKYIGSLIDSMEPKEYEGDKLWQQTKYSVETEKQKTSILNRLYLKLKNILGDLI